MAIDAGTIVVTVVPNTSGFTSKLTSLMTGVGKSLEKAGIGATQAGIGAAIGVTAVAATKAALDFEAAFTRIDAISNASADNISQWKDQVLELSGTTAQSPQELADALYFLASAGLETEDVMSTLAASAQASAVGLGDTAVIARLNAQALNAYADSGLTATQATDTLIAAVKAGTAEPEEFAESLGRVLPIASRAGVSYAEVAASLASLSNIGLDVSIGTTALRGLLSALVAPGTEAAQTMAELGISTQQMRDVLAEGGLLKALSLLETRTDGNIDVLKKIVPNIRALTAELGLTGENAEHVQEIFTEVAFSTGDLGEAMATTASGPMFQFQLVAANAQRVLIELGQGILPIATLFAETLGGALSFVADLISEHTGLIVGLGAAYLGIKFVPVILDLISAALVRMAGAALANIATGLYAIAKGLLAIGATRSAVTIAFVAQTILNLAKYLPLLTTAIGPLVVGLVGLRIIFDSVNVTADSLGEKFKTLSDEATNIADKAGEGLGFSEWAGFLADPLATSGQRADEFGATMERLNKEGVAMGLSLEETNAILEQHGDLLTYNRASQEGFNEAVEKSFNAATTARTEAALKSILTFREEIQRTGDSGTYIASTFSKYGEVLLNNQKLSVSQKAAVAGQIEQIYQLGGSLNAATDAWLDQKLAAGEFDKIADKLNGQIKKLSAGLEDGAAAGRSAFLEISTAGSQLANAIGTNFQDMSKTLQEAFVDDENTLGENVEDVISGIIDRVNQLRQTFADSLGGFMGDALGKLAEQTSFTTDGVIASFHKATEAAKAFGQDLLTISKTGGAAGQDLATQLAGLGPSAATFANFIASASDKAREKMVSAFGAGQDAVGRFATKITEAIVGPLKNIQATLEAIAAQEYDIHMNFDDGGAQQAIRNIASGLNGLPATKVINIQLNREGYIGPTPKDVGSEFGSYLPGAARGGFVAAPTVLNVGERHKAEMILPLENKQGVGALARAMGMAARSLDGGKTRGGNGGSAKLVLEGPVQLRVGKTSMDAYISGVARAEDDKQSRYDERLSRMRRD